MSAENLGRWKSMVSKILAKSGGMNWDAIVSSVRVLGFVPIDEEAMEEMMRNQMCGRRSSIMAETRISGVDHSAAAAAAAYRAALEATQEQPEQRESQLPEQPPPPLSSQLMSRRGSRTAGATEPAAPASQASGRSSPQPSDSADDGFALRKSRFRLGPPTARSPQVRSPHVTRPTSPRPECEVDPDSPAGSVAVFRDTLERAFAVSSMVDQLAEQRAAAIDTFAMWALPNRSPYGTAESDELRRNPPCRTRRPDPNRRADALPHALGMARMPGARHAAAHPRAQVSIRDMPLRARYDRTLAVRKGGTSGDGGISRSSSSLSIARNEAIASLSGSPDASGRASPLLDVSASRSGSRQPSVPGSQRGSPLGSPRGSPQMTRRGLLQDANAAPPLWSAHTAPIPSSWGLVRRILAVTRVTDPELVGVPNPGPNPYSGLFHALHTLRTPARCVPYTIHRQATCTPAPLPSPAKLGEIPRQRCGPVWKTSTLMPFDDDDDPMPVRRADARARRR